MRQIECRGYCFVLNTHEFLNENHGQEKLWFLNLITITSKTLNFLPGHLL